jgi:acetylornithine deacetylase/succinyl-diaminopimelate desuccinylase family protein
VTAAGASTLRHDAGAIERLVADLVAIDSVNPDLVPGAAGEAEIAAFVAAWLRDAGLEVVVDDPPGTGDPPRPSVVGVARGRGGGRSLLLCAHTDTVGIEGMTDPHVPRVAGGRLYGRGAYDMKGGLAACLVAGAAAAQAGVAGDVVVAAVSDEEYASVGCRSVAERFAGAADAAIVTEPTGLRACVAHKGFAWATIEARGRAAHGSRPDLGADAIVHMGAVLAEVSALDRRLADERASARHALLGRGSVHASLIAGGQELSSYPERCTLEIERRTLPGETAQVVEAEIADVLRRAGAREPALEATARVTLVREPFEIAADAAIVRAVRAAGAAVTGREVDVVGHTAWMDAAVLGAAGVPTIVFGPGGEGAHAVEEWVDLAEVEQCARTLAAVAAGWCR